MLNFFPKSCSSSDLYEGEMSIDLEIVEIEMVVDLAVAALFVVVRC